jgi:hypothetical protein
MIPKITSPQFPASQFSLRSPANEGPGKDSFQSLLENRLASPSPLEGLALSLLIEIINKIMVNAEGEALFCPGPLPLSEGPGPPPLGARTGPPALEETPPGLSLPEGGRQEIDRKIREAAAAHGVEADLVRAVIEVESGFNPRAVSPAGARGLMQLMPATAADLGVQNPFDAGQNIVGGTRYLRQLLDRYGGNRRLALAAYNWGMGNLEKKPDSLPKETRQYVLKVENAYRRYAGEPRPETAGRA